MQKRLTELFGDSALQVVDRDHRSLARLEPVGSHTPSQLTELGNGTYLFGVVWGQRHKAGPSPVVVRLRSNRRRGRPIWTHVNVKVASGGHSAWWLWI